MVALVAALSHSSYKPFATQMNSKTEVRSIATNSWHRILFRKTTMMLKKLSQKHFNEGICSVYFVFKQGEGTVTVMARAYRVIPKPTKGFLGLNVEGIVEHEARRRVRVMC